MGTSSCTDPKGCCWYLSWLLSCSVPSQCRVLHSWCSPGKGDGFLRCSKRMRRFYKVILCPQSSRCSSSEVPDFLLHDFTSWVASERGTGKRPEPCFVAQVKALHLQQQLPSSQVPARHRTRTDTSPEKGKPGHQPWGGDHEQQQGWAVGTGEPSKSRDNTSSGPALPQFPLQPFPCHGHFGFDLPSDPQAMGSELGWVPLPKTLPSATLPPPQNFARNFLKTPQGRRAEVQLRASLGAAPWCSLGRLQPHVGALPSAIHLPLGTARGGLFLKGMQLSQKPHFEVCFKALLS